MTDIFISYASEDRARAGQFAAAFEARGWAVWWDRRIVPGQAFDAAIEQALEAAKCVVVLWSPDSAASEWVKNEAAVGAERGVVSQITTRYTVLKGMTGIESIVPNETLVGSVVQNETFTDPKVRISLPIQVSYATDLEKAMAIMIEAAQAQPRVMEDPAPGAFLESFADSGINLQLGFWIRDPAEGTLGIRSAINMQIWRRFKEEGIEIPFPQREVRVLAEAGGGA